MPRQAVIIRPATEDDIPVLLEMHSAMREASPRAQRTSRLGRESVRLGAGERYREALQSPEHRVLLAITPDGEVGGMTMLVHTDFSLALETHVVHVAQTCVRANHRRRGVGRALMAAAAGWAEEMGVGSVALSVLPAQRETHRYYARLGFSPRVVLRMASVSTLRRTLGLESMRPSIARRHSVGVPRALRVRRAASALEEVQKAS